MQMTVWRLRKLAAFSKLKAAIFIVSDMSRVWDEMDIAMDIAVDIGMLVSLCVLR